MDIHELKAKTTENLILKGEKYSNMHNACYLYKIKWWSDDDDVIKVLSCFFCLKNKNVNFKCELFTWLFCDVRDIEKILM